MTTATATATDEAAITGEIAIRLCQPQGVFVGSFCLTRHNERLWCAHGETVMSSLRKPPKGVSLTAYRRSIHLEAAGNLRAATGCGCRLAEED